MASLGALGAVRRVHRSMLILHPPNSNPRIAVNLTHFVDCVTRFYLTHHGYADTVPIVLSEDMKFSVFGTSVGNVGKVAAASNRAPAEGAGWSDE